MKQNEVVIVVNPGSTSTKFALFNRDGVVVEETVRHEAEAFDKFDLVTDQFSLRFEMIDKAVKKAAKEHSLTIVGSVGRGGPVKPLKGGTYRISEELLSDLKSCKFANHASNLGGMIASEFASVYNLSDSYVVDPVTTDNMWDKARLSGLPGIERACRVHALNIKAVARHIAKEKNISFEKGRFIVAHMGGGISIAALDGGQIVDVNDGLLGMGPFSPERAGALPLRGLMKLCYSMDEGALKKKLSKESGLQAYLGTNDFREVVKMIDNGDENAQKVVDAFVYQVGKEIGSYAAAMEGKVDAVIVTGGIAHQTKFTDELKKYVSWIADYHIFPGENELQALAEGAFRVIDKEETPQEY